MALLFNFYHSPHFFLPFIMENFHNYSKVKTDVLLSPPPGLTVFLLSFIMGLPHLQTLHCA